MSGATSSFGAFLVANEASLRLAGFTLVLLLLAAVERRWPARGDARPARRQAVNLGLILIDTLMLRLAFPLLAVALAMQVEARGGGLFGALTWPGWLEMALAVLAFDLAIYWQHRLLHGVPVLWRLHRVHHSDLHIDATTGVRFHPFEIALSMGIKLGMVVLLGPDPAAVVIFELLLSAGSLFTHADFALSPRIERIARWAIVTPSMHRIHHSVRRDEADSNFGTTVSIWDRAFASYCAAPARPERTMPIGPPAWRDPAAPGLWALLLQPFRRVPDGSGEVSSDA